MREERPGKEHKLDLGARRLLHDLRHKTSREVALSHKAIADGRRAKDVRDVRERIQWEAADRVLMSEEGHDRTRSEHAADWPHATSLEQYCSICACFGCKAQSPKE